MGVKADYATSVRNEIDRYAVWEPGHPFKLGDFGELHDKTFEKRGNISDFGVSFETTASAPVLYEFTSTGTSVAETSLDASVNAGVPAPRASVEFKFAHERGLFLRAADSFTISISNLEQLASELSALPDWKFHWKIVSEIRVASSAILLMGRTANTKVKIEASVDAIEQLMLGKLAASAALNIAGEVGYKIIGARGPLFLDLIRVRRFFGGAIRQLDGHVTQSAFERLSTGPEVEDDPKAGR
jgi:hypothetical protein